MFDSYIRIPSAPMIIFRPEMSKSKKDKCQENGIKDCAQNFLLSYFLNNCEEITKPYSLVSPVGILPIRMREELLEQTAMKLLLSLFIYF